MGHILLEHTFRWLDGPHHIPVQVQTIAMRLNGNAQEDKVLHQSRACRKIFRGNDPSDQVYDAQFRAQ